MTFANYLKQKRFTSSTVRSYEKTLGYFTDWLDTAQLTAASFTYTELLDFMRDMTRKGKSKKTLSHVLGIIRHYCNYLVHEGKRKDNPAAGVFIRGLVRKLPANLLSAEEMEELYKQYSIQLRVDPAKKIMLGLLVYQGLRTDELMRLEGSQFKIREGKVFIKGTKRTSERWLKLEAVQIPILQAYLNENKHNEGPLFAGKNISGQVQQMLQQLRRLNPRVINAGQLRSSVITHWLKRDHLRQVQYMAGHKYVSSTQRYQLNHLDDLQNEVLHHHPMS